MTLGITTLSPMTLGITMKNMIISVTTINTLKLRIMNIMTLNTMA